MYEDHPEGCSARYHESAQCTCGVRFAAQHPSKKAENTHGIAGEAHDLVYGARAATYGHPRLDFTIIANVWTGLLQDKLKDGERLDPYRVAVMMTGLKLARLVKSPGHHDSRADTIGYMLTMERLDEPEADPDQKVWNYIDGAEEQRKDHRES